MFKSLVKQSAAGLRVLIVFTVLLGVIYPLGVWAVSRVPGLESKAEGSIISANGQAAGSSLIGIDPVYDQAPADDPNTAIAENLADPLDPFFHVRPSASYSGPEDYPEDAQYPAALGQGDPSTSGGSNKGGFDEKLLGLIQARKDTIAQREGVSPDAVPADAVTASASGVDPTVSEAYAELQIARVARNNGLSVEKVRQLVDENTTGYGIGIPGVNVLELNLAVQAAAGK